MSAGPHGCGRKRSQRGFTLLELLVALAIAAILAVLATSGYETILMRSRRLDARAALVAVASAQERHRLEHGRYAVEFDPTVRDGAAADASAATDAGAAATDPAAEPPADRLPLAATSPDGHYLLEIATDADALVYEAIARPRGIQQRDGTCARLTLDHTGHRTARDTRGADTTGACWR